MEGLKKIKVIDITTETILIENSIRVRRFLIDLIQKVAVKKKEVKYSIAIYRTECKNENVLVKLKEKSNRNQFGRHG